MLTPSELVVAAIACDIPTAERIVAHMGETTVRDAAAFALLESMAEHARRDLKNEPAAPVTITKDERARQLLASRGIDLSSVRGEKKFALYSRALAEIDRADNGATHEERVLANFAFKAPGSITAVDRLALANARLRDGKPQFADGPPLPAIARPAADPSAPLDPARRLRESNRLSGVSLSAWRNWNRAHARAAALPPGVDRMNAEEHVRNLARACALHGVTVPE